MTGAPRRGGPTGASARLAGALTLLLAGCASAPRPGAGEQVAGAHPFTASELAAFASARMGGLRDCYEAGLARAPGLEGKVLLRFQLLASGAVAAVEVVSSTLGAPEVEGCLAAEVARWRTPFRPDEPLSVEYPLGFQPASGEGGVPGRPADGR